MKFLQESLLELGFTKNDATVYLAVVQHGPCNAGPIVQATNLHRYIVYSSIQQLEARKLVTEKVVNGRKIFSATSLKALADEFGQKAELAQNVSLGMEELARSEPEEIVVYQGRKDYINLLSGLLDAMPRNAIEYIYGTSSGRLMSKYIKSFNRNYVEKLRRSKNKVRIIAYEANRQDLEQDLKRLPSERYEVRYLKDNLPDPRVLDVYPELNTVLHNIYSEDGRSITAIKIVNKTYAQECLQFCEELWKKAA